MSRDFRPIEMYMLSKESDPDFLFLNAVWNIQGKEVRMYDNKQKNIILSYEYLGRCSPILTLKLHDFFEKHDRLDVMKDIENDVRNYIENNDQNINEDIKKWLKGEHDPAFYYREKNDEVFLKKMEDKYKCKIISINELKGLYDSLNAADISDRSELIDAVNNNDIYKLFKIDCVGKDEYEMTHNNKEYTISWSKTYPVNMMIEDVVRAMQVLSDIEIEGVHNTPSLINKLIDIDNWKDVDYFIDNINSDMFDDVDIIDKLDNLYGSGDISDKLYNMLSRSPEVQKNIVDVMIDYLKTSTKEAKQELEYQFEQFPQWYDAHELSCITYFDALYNWDDVYLYAIATELDVEVDELRNYGEHQLSDRIANVILQKNVIDNDNSDKSVDNKKTKIRK